MPTPSPTLSATTTLARDLVRCPSITPDDHGCQQLIAKRLSHAGFVCRHMPFGAVSNLWAYHGDGHSDGDNSGAPCLVFAGHTDVVPSGPEARWQRPPFAAEIADGILYGRGAADMKGGVAAMVTACERFVAAHPKHPGRVALLITSDEEGEAVNGTVRVLQTLHQEGQQITWCIVGEPSSDKCFGDVIKIGRRGSLSGTLTVRGIQGHVGYPHRARNPIHESAPFLVELIEKKWDRGGDGFEPTSLQISNLHGGEGALNVIPGQMTVHLNFRYAPASTMDDLKNKMDALCRRHLSEYEITWRDQARPFLTKAGTLRDALSASIVETTGIKPCASTVGGTSDARFIATSGAQVVEFGVRNASIHQVDEHVAIAELEQSSAIYELVIEKLLLESNANNNRAGDA